LNTQYDFAQNVFKFIQKGYLQRGDVLVFDNWSGHFGYNIIEALCTQGARHSYCYEAGSASKFKGSGERSLR
jgi:hypothetical protein